MFEFEQDSNCVKRPRFNGLHEFDVIYLANYFPDSSYSCVVCLNSVTRLVLLYSETVQSLQLSDILQKIKVSMVFATFSYVGIILLA